MLKIFKDNRLNIDRKILPRRLTLSIKDKKLRKEIKIAEVSLDLFREKGIEKTSIREIMKRSGFGLGTFYLYFKDKKDLEEKIVSDIFTDLVLNGEKKVEGIEDNKERYIAFMSYIIDELIKDPLKLELISKNTNRALYAKVGNDARFKEADTTLKFLLNRYDSMFPEKLSEEEQLYILFLTVQILLITCKASFEKDSVLTIEEMKPVLFRIVERILG